VKDQSGKNGWTWNPITGCKTGCEYCYARRLAERFGQSFEPTAHGDRMAEITKTGLPRRTIFVGSMTDMFGPWIDKDDNLRQFRNSVLDAMRYWSRHTYLMLTKWPEYTRRIGTTMPDNWWLGVSVERQERLGWLLSLKHHAPRGGHLFASFEPLLGPVKPNPHEINHLDWIIIGAQTGPGAVKPERAWVEDIVLWAAVCNVPVFVKDNLIRHYPEFAPHRKIPYLGGMTCGG